MPNWCHEPCDREAQPNKDSARTDNHEKRKDERSTKTAATSTNTEHSVNKIKEFKDSNYITSETLKHAPSLLTRRDVSDTAARDVTSSNNLLIVSFCLFGEAQQMDYTTHAKSWHPSTHCSPQQTTFSPTQAQFQWRFDE